MSNQRFDGTMSFYCQRCGHKVELQATVEKVTYSTGYGRSGESRFRINGHSFGSSRPDLEHECVE